MKYLFRAYQWCIATPIIIIATILTSVFTVILSPFDRSYFGYYVPKWWGRLWCALMFVKIKVIGREKINRRTSYVFVANHQGAFDIFSIYGYIGHNFRWMMRKGLTNIPFVGTACQMAGHIMVDHRNAHTVKKTMADAEKRLRNGMSIVVFPEGRRTDTGKMGTFKSGAFKLAVEFNLPVVPITIDGSYQVMPRSTFNITPGTITITMHTPIMPGENGHDAHTLSKMCFDTIASALPQEQSQQET